MANGVGLSFKNDSIYGVAQPPQYVIVPSTRVITASSYDAFVPSRKKGHFFRNLGIMSILGVAALAFSRGKINAIKTINTKIPLKDFKTYTDKAKALVAKSGEWILNKLDFNLKDVITKSVVKK